MTVALEFRQTAETRLGRLSANAAGSFAAWRGELERRHIPPVISVAGTRGKTTVSRLIESIFKSAGLRTAIWTNSGVEVNGRGQDSELGAWGSALRRLGAGTLDVAVQELDWPTIHAVGLPPETYPLSIVTNICLNNDRCLMQPDAFLATRAYKRLREATRRDGLLILNGDDYSVAGAEIRPHAVAILVGQNRDAPLLRTHLSDGGQAAWVEDNSIVFGTATSSRPVVAVDRLAFAWSGDAVFEIHSALLAVAAASACGIEISSIRGALEGFSIPHSAQASFNLVPVGDALAIVERPAPSWFLRHVVRAIKHRPHRRLVTTVGLLDQAPEDDLEEVGRLLARVSDVVIFHSEEAESARHRALQAGLGSADDPVVLLRRANEEDAILTAVSRLRPGDFLLALADQPEQTLNSLLSAMSSASPKYDQEG